MSETKFKNGDKVYTVHGWAAIYVGPLPDGSHCIVPIYDVDDDPVKDEPTTVSAVFDDPPSISMSAEVRKLRDEIERAEAELGKIKREIHEERNAQTALLGRITQHEGLENLDKLLAGRITHVVHVDGKGIPVVKSAEDEKEYYEVRTLRLLSFVPSQKYPTGKVFWSFSSDSHDADKWTIPCMSRDDAIAKATALMEATFAKRREEKNTDIYFLTEAYAACAAIGHEMPQDLLEALMRYRAKDAEAALKRAHDATTKAQTAFDAANEQLRLAVERRQKEGATK